MPRIELAQLLRPTTTPEQELLLEHFYTQFDNSSAANRRIVNVEPLYYIGALAATEFLVYAATRLYLCYCIDFITNWSINTAPFITDIRDENDVQCFFIRNNSLSWNSTASNDRYQPNNILYKNIYFSRIVPSAGLINILFNGYRVTLI